MKALAARRASGHPAAALPRLSIVLTAAFAVFTIGATVVGLAAFAALLIGGRAGAHALFALIAGSLAFSALALIQFIQWAVLLLKLLRDRT